MSTGIIDYSNPNSLGSRLRARRLSYFWPLIEQTRQIKSAVSVLDIGGTRDYWRMLSTEALIEAGITLTIVNIERSKGTEENGPFRYIEADGCDLSQWSDFAFDVVHSNSVIEHVGNWKRMAAFAHEVRRLAPSYFVQTPNFWFPLEPHYMRPFVHWLPEPVRARMLTISSIGNYARVSSMGEAMTLIQGNQLLSRAMLAELFPDSIVHTERVALFPKSLMAVRTR